MKRFLAAALLVALQLFTPAWAATRYVSSTTDNGFIVGTNSGAGTAGAPWLTVAYAVVNATDGDTIVVNGNAASPVTYPATTAYSITTKSLTIIPVVDYGVILTPTGAQGQVINFGFSGGSLTLGALILDAGGNSNNGLQLADTAVAMNVTLNGTRIRNWIQNCVSAAGTATKVNLTSTAQCREPTVGTRGGYFFNGLIEGAINIPGGDVIQGNNNTATFAALYVLARAASGVTVNVDGFTASVTLDPSLTGTSSHYVVKVWNVPNVRIANSTLSYEANGTTRTLAALWVSANTAAPAFDSSGAMLISNTIFANAAGTGSYGIVVGQNGSFPSADGLANGALLDGNRFYGSAAFETAGHAYLCGFVTTCTMSRSYAERANIGFLFKDVTTSGLGYSNVATRITGQAFRIKGGANVTFANNTHVRPSSTYTSAYALYADVDNVTLVPTTGAVFKNNISFDAVSTVGGGHLFVDNVSDATGANNAYFTAGGGVPSNAWLYHSVIYSTPATWLAAGRESVAFFGDPMMQDVSVGDFRLRPGSPVRAFGSATTGVAVDFAGRPLRNPPPAGVFRAPQFSERGHLMQ